jgi:hypothetical protein
MLYEELFQRLIVHAPNWGRAQVMQLHVSSLSTWYLSLGWQEREDTCLHGTPAVHLLGNHFRLLSLFGTDGVGLLSVSPSLSLERQQEVHFGAHFMNVTD